MPFSRLSWALLLLACGCGRAARPGGAPLAVEASVERQAFDLATDALRRGYLDRDTVPGPVVSYEAQTQRQEHFSVTVSPVLAERQPWNEWPDGTARLFNDAIGYLWRVEVHSDQEARWSPAHTVLAVNDSEQTFLAIAQPDDLLVHLLTGAREERRVGAPANLSLRIRNADDFRHAYLGTDARAGDRTGVLVFPAPTRNLQAVAMQLTVGFWTEDEGVKQYRFLFE
ncbi:MAG: hypothetical protein Q8P18_09230 [Pseudomonadota bacterium]|nr:hypothetical protein [Pseudomonadota bacterium]